MYNKKVLIDSLKKLGSAKAPTKKPDIIYEPKGQLKYPGQNTRIPSGDITMQGVPYPVYAQPNVGQPQMMYPGQNYQFPGADYVDEYPQMKKGGRTKGLISMPKPSKKGLMSKKYSRSLDATNKFFTQNYLFAKPKSRKNKVFDPNANYAKGGQSNETHITSKDGVETPIYKKVDIKPSKIHGNGLFTKEAIKKNEPIGICHVKNKDGQLIPSTILGMYNHNKKTPNVYEINKGDHVVMMPLRDISPGEELTADYDMVPIEGLQDSSSFQDAGEKKFLKKKNGGESECPMFYKRDPISGECIPFTETEKSEYGTQYMKDWVQSPMYNEMLNASVAKDITIGDKDRVLNDEEKVLLDKYVNKYSKNITDLRLKATNPKVSILESDNDNSPLGEAYPYQLKDLIYFDDPSTLKFDAPFNAPGYSKGNDNNLQGIVNYYTKNYPGEHAYVYPHEVSHLQDMGGSLIPQSDINMMENYAFTPENEAVYQNMRKERQLIIDKYPDSTPEMDKELSELYKKYYPQYDKRYNQDKELYEKDFNKYKVQNVPKQLTDIWNTLDNTLPYDEFIKKYKRFGDPVNKHKYISNVSETRARLNAIRMYGQASGIYNPFEEKLSPEKYKELQNLFYQQNPNDVDSNQLRQLREVYTDEEIFNLLNSISKNEPQQIDELKTPQAKQGGALDKFVGGGQGLVHAQDGINTDAMTGMMKARLAYANEFGNPAAKRMINLPDTPYQFDNGDTGTHYMASMDNYAVPQIQDENGVLQLGDYGPKSNEAIRFDSDEDANYFAEHYKDVSPGFINQKQYGGLHKFVEGGAEASWPPKGWPPIGNYKGLLGLVKKVPTVNTFGNALKLPAVNWTTPSIPTLKREFNVEQVLKNQNFFPDENSFLNAVKNATVQEITPEIDATIGYRSGTTTKEQLLELSKTYASYPQYRNEGTIDAIFDGLKSGAEMEMPMVLQFPNGNKRVFSGNTRMDASRQLGINPNVLMLNVPDMTKLANPWQREVFPGLQYKSTMLSNPKGLWTQVAKDGTINVENALKSIEKESAGDVKVELLKETLGENIPKKMDFNLFRKKTQETIIPLETTIVDHSSNYGIGNVGYPAAKRSSFEKALEFNNQEIAEIEEKIKYASSKTRQLNSWDDATEQSMMMNHIPFDKPIYEAIGPNGFGQYFPTLEEAKQQEEITLRILKEKLKNSINSSYSTLTEMHNLPLENKTVIFSNKDLFGVGSDAHSNPPETLGHIHFLRDADFPDILLATQIQSDPFQSKNYWKYNINDETEALGTQIRRKASRIESTNDYIAGGAENSGYPKEKWEELKLSSLEEINELNNEINILKETLEPIVKKYTPNYKQKVLLDKNHKKRFFQEFLNYAANRGDVNYIAIPTVETSARIQNYSPLEPKEQPGPESQLLMDNSNSFEEFVKKAEEMNGESFQNATEQVKYILKKGYELYKKDGTLKGLLNDKRNYKSKHGTVLGNYEEYIKIAKKLGLEIEDVIIKGHTYKKIVIPEDFLKGVGEIDAYKKGGATNKSIEINLTPEEIKKYVNGGYVVEELDNYQDGGTTDPPPPWNPDYPINFYEFESLSPEERASRDKRSNYVQALTNEPKYADEALEFVKGWHDSPMYNQMVLNSYNGQQKNADYLTKLRKKNIADIPPINIMDETHPDDENIQGESNSLTGQVTVFPIGFEQPGLYVHEFTHSSDRPRELYKYDHPSYTFQSSENPLHYEFKIPSWMYYKDPRFPNESYVNHSRVMPKSDQMYISTHRGANWKDNERYKTRNSVGLYTTRTDDQLKEDLITSGFDPNESEFNNIFEDIKKEEKNNINKYKKEDQESWQEYGHGYVSSPTEVRARLATIRMNAKKKGIYDPYTEQITPEIFENYINKQLEDEDYNALEPIDQLRHEFTDEEILHMLRTISQNKNDSKTENEFDMQYSQYGGVADYQLGDEVDEDTMKTLKKLGYTFNKI